jgi:polyhydroxyalkanoate synthesis repressor PhaR
MPATRVIKKYPNRRLYDTEISSYITIEDVRQLIVDGEAFVVRDARSGDDLTRLVLLQIIAEQEQEGRAMLSTGLLAGIIRLHGDPALGTHLEHSLQAFLASQSPAAGEAAGRRSGQIAGASAPVQNRSR